MIGQSTPAPQVALRTERESTPLSGPCRRPGERRRGEGGVTLPPAAAAWLRAGDHRPLILAAGFSPAARSPAEPRETGRHRHRHRHTTPTPAPIPERTSEMSIRPLCELFTMLEASSVLYPQAPHSKKFWNTFCKVANHVI